MGAVDLPDSLYKEAILLGYVTFPLRVGNVLFEFRSLTEDQTERIRKSLYFLNLGQVNTLVVSLSLESVMIGSTICRYPLKDVDSNLEIISEAISEVPALYVGLMASKVNLETSKVFDFYRKSMEDKGFLEGYWVYNKYVSENPPYDLSHFHARLISMVESKTQTLKNNYLWELTKFLASMWDPKFIKKIESREKAKNMTHSESMLQDLIVMYGEERGIEIYNKIKSGDIKTEDEDVHKEIGSDATDPTIATPVGYTFDEKANKYTHEDTNIRVKKELLYANFMASQDPDKLDKHDKAVREHSIQRISSIEDNLARRERMKNMDVTDVQIILPEPTARQTLKKPVFRGKRR